MAVPKVLVAYFHRPMCAGLFWPMAFRQAGCEVRTAGPQDPTVWGHEFPPEDFVAPYFPLDTHANQSMPVEMLVRHAMEHGFAPDLVLFCDQYDFFYLTGEAPAGTKFAWIAVENWNDLQSKRTTERKADAEYYQISHHHQTSNVDGWPVPHELPIPPPPLAQGAEWLTFGFDPFVHPLLGLPRDKYVCQIGSAYEPRPAVWNQCRRDFDQADAIPDSAYGRDLFESTHTIFGRVPSYRKHAESYNRAWCALSSSNVPFIPMRVAEALGMGCVLLSDDFPEIRTMLGDPYPANLDGVWVAHDRTGPGTVRAIELVRALPERTRNELLDRCIATAYRSHTYAHHARRILARVGLEGAGRTVS